MKIFLDSGKTLLPRLDQIYLQTRALAGVFIVCWLALGYVPERYFWLAIGTLVALILHFGLLLYTSRQPRIQLYKTYLASIVLDVTAISLWVHIDGGFTSPFFLGYYLVASFGAYLLAHEAAYLLTGLICVIYASLLWYELQGALDWITIAVRMGPIWLFVSVISHVAEHLRQSESRMLKLFDTLTQRTAELEKIQAQLESIYDNSRILASILDVDEVAKAVMQIVNGVLKYPAAALLLKQGEHGFVFRGRVIDSEINLRLKALDESSADLLRRVSRGGSPVRIIDIRARDDYQPLKSDTRSVMFAPMTVRRNTVGILVAESTVKGAFSERDEKMFWVVARSAAMALDNAIVHQEMEELSVTDDLTGIANFRQFTTKLAEEERRSARYNQPLSLIMLDIDHFKNFNDTYGHEAGNLALKGVTEVVQGCIRDTDIFARYGGEEFAIILPQTTLYEARQIANRIRESIERTRFHIGEGFPRQSITVSVGLTSYPENGKAESELLPLADQALYRAKGSGRNVVQEV